MLALPEKFDSNEWYIIITILVTYTIIFLLPKRFPQTISLLVLLFSMTYAQVLDHVLAGKGLDLYDINDSEKYEWMDLVAWFLYPPFGYVYVYYYDKWKIRKTGIFWYIIIWTFIAVGVEALSLKFHYFNYHDWKLIYSVPVYLITLGIFLLFFILINKYFYKLKVPGTGRGQLE